MESATQERHATGKQLISTDFRVMGSIFFLVDMATESDGGM